MRGIVRGLGEGVWITVIAPASELYWPPRSGLTCVNQRWTTQTDAEGHFLIADLPAQVPLSVRRDAGSTAEGVTLTSEELVLSPGEQHEVVLDAHLEAGSKPREASTVEGGEHWVSVDTSSFASLTWFEFLNGARLIQHRVGGGRWHVHQNRACNHLEIRPGRSTLIGRDASGRIGVELMEVTSSESAIRPRVKLAAGGLLRIDGSRLNAKASIKFTLSGQEFAVRELLPGAVSYETAPAGSVRMTVAIDGREPETRSIDVAAGAVVDLAL